MADGRQQSAFLIENAYLSREGDEGWHLEGPECHGLLPHVHPKSRPPLIVWRAKRSGIRPTIVESPHPVPRWEVRVTHFHEDGSVASEVETLYEHELAARELPIGPWASVRAIAGAAVSRIRHSERAAGR